MKKLVASMLAAAALALPLSFGSAEAKPAVTREIADTAREASPLVTQVHYRRYRRHYRPYVYYRPYYRPRYYGYYHRPYRPRYYYGGYYHRPYGYYYRPRPVFGFSFGPVGFYRW